MKLTVLHLNIWQNLRINLKLLTLVTIYTLKIILINFPYSKNQLHGPLLPNRNKDATLSYQCCYY